MGLLAQTIQLPEKVGPRVVVVSLTALITALIVLTLWLSIRRFLTQKLEPTNGRGEKAAERGVHSIGDQMYDIGADVGEIRADIKNVHEDLREGFADNQHDHDELKRSVREEHLSRRQHEMKVDRRLDDVDAKLDRHGHILAQHQDRWDAEGTDDG
jgi:hypothetical protein